MRLLREPWPQPTIHCIIDYGMGAIVSAHPVLHRCHPQPGSYFSLADHLLVCGPFDGDGGAWGERRLRHPDSIKLASSLTDNMDTELWQLGSSVCSPFHTSCKYVHILSSINVYFCCRPIPMPFLPRCLRGVVSLLSSQNRISFSGGYSAVKVHEGTYKSTRFVHEASICPLTY